MATIVIMKKRNYLFSSIMTLIVLLCTATTTAQEINSLAECNVDNDQAEFMQQTPQALPTFRSPAPAARVPMSTRAGDVNNDGKVNIDDVTELISLLLNGNSSYTAGTDVNGDGKINIDDITELINMLLQGQSNFTSTSAINDLNEIYKSMRTAGWSTTGNTHQCFGISAYNLMAEVMGDDMIMGDQGSGWFWFDASYNVKQRYTSSSWRSHDLWTAYYTWIGNANYLLSACSQMAGVTESELNYIKGQAYAIRAYSYFMLAQSFARTYKGHESDPCVPLFTGAVFNGTTGALRSTVAQVYAQIDADINQAITLLNGTTQQAPEHIGYAVALGLRARIALVEEDWTTAYNSAVAAINASGKSVQEVTAFIGMNDAHAGNVMWGADIPTNEVGMYASLWAHMSTNIAYGQRAPKQISKWLYNKMSDTDARLAWWDPSNQYSTRGYVQQKFNLVPGTEWDGDYIWMRIEEMFLTAAEAACRRGLTTTAKNYLTRLMNKRDANYTCNKTGTQLGTLTTDETGSLLEEILIQRRLELWGEDGRIYTIRRLRQGFERTSNNGWPNGLLLTNHANAAKDPESYLWVLTIPQSEFYNYYSRLIEEVDQNPIGDYPAGEGGEIERTPQHISFVNEAQSMMVEPATSLYATLHFTRPNTSDKPYHALVRYQKNNYSFNYFYVTFLKGETTTEVTVNLGEQSLGHTTYTFLLTDLEMSVANSSQVTTCRLEVDCVNLEPEGQNISFTSATQELSVSVDEWSSSGYAYAIEVPLTRAITTHNYTATLSISDTVGDINFPYYNSNVTFNAGESTATTTVGIYNLTPGGTYSFKLSLSDDDIATRDPEMEQITTTTVTFHYTPSQWVDAGKCTFTDYTWEDGYSATNVPIQRLSDTNTYRIVSPLYYVYNGVENSPSTANWQFTLNDDGSITPMEGTWDLNYWGYIGYYNTNDYSQYCYVTQDGNTYDVNFLVQNGSSLYTGGRFVFTWDR